MARILIIDDNRDMLKMLRMMLEKRGQHEVTTYADGQEGLEYALYEKPEVAVVDVMMPDISGYDVVKKLRNDPRTRDMGIIILTARGHPVDREAALAAGADEHLAKPVDMEALLSGIDAALHRERTPPDDAPSEHTPAPKPKPLPALVVPVFSLRGGIGVTTLAVNLATIFQQVAPTLLLDLSPNSGHAALFLGLRVQQHWGNLLAAPDTPLDSLLLQHASGLQVLAAPPAPLPQAFFSEAEIAGLLKQLEQFARICVVDMPPVLNPTARAVLAQAATIILVTGDDPPAIQTTLATVQALQEYKDRIVLVRNTLDSALHPPPDAVQRALRCPLAVDVPYDATQGAALRKGLPLAAVQPKSPMVTGMKRVVQIVLTQMKKRQ